MVAALEDLRAVGVDIVTIGQYLRPTDAHVPLSRYWEPEEFERLGAIGREIGFAHVESSPLTRSSYHARRAADATVSMTVSASDRQARASRVATGRVTRVRERMSTEGVDTLLLSLGADLPWLVGYEAMPLERPTVLVLRRDELPVLVVPELEAPRVEPDADLFAIWPWSETDDPVAIVAGLTAPGPIGLSDRMWASLALSIQRRLPGAATFVAASRVTGPVRTKKDARRGGGARRRRRRGRPGRRRPVSRRDRAGRQERSGGLVRDRTSARRRGPRSRQLRDRGIRPECGEPASRTRSTDHRRRRGGRLRLRRVASP